MSEREKGKLLCKHRENLKWKLDEKKSCVESTTVDW